DISSTRGFLEVASSRLTVQRWRCFELIPSPVRTGWTLTSIAASRCAGCGRVNQPEGLRSSSLWSTTMNRWFLMCVSVIAVFPYAALGDDSKKDKSSVDGTWQATSAELSGKKWPKKVTDSLKLTLKKGEYEVTAESKDRGTVTYDDTADPKEMESKGREGPNNGKTFLEIYELDGDKLKICYDLSGKSRPAEFKTKADTKLFLVTYERKKS